MEVVSLAGYMQEAGMRIRDSLAVGTLNLEVCEEIGLSKNCDLLTRCDQFLCASLFAAQLVPREFLNVNVTHYE